MRSKEMRVTAVWAIVIGLSPIWLPAMALMTLARRLEERNENKK